MNSSHNKYNIEGLEDTFVVTITKLWHALIVLPVCVKFWLLDSTNLESSDFVQPWSTDMTPSENKKRVSLAEQ